jgi:hypothetical protein
MKVRLLLIAILLSLTQFGCPQIPGGLPDLDNDGFDDLPVPEGVDDSRGIQIDIVNELTKQQFTDSLASSADFPPQFVGLINTIQINIRFDITLSYENGEEVEHTESETLRPFGIQLEAACPQDILVKVTVSITAPLVGNVPVVEESFTFVQGGEGGENSFECDTVLRASATFDGETGQPVFDVSFDPVE